MPSNLNLDYYYGTEAEQYSFYRVPKTLLTDSRYKGVSIEAKVLYGLLLDRMSLSVRNGWMDKDRRVYIYFTQEDAMALMNCGKDQTPPEGPQTAESQQSRPLDSAAVKTAPFEQSAPLEISGQDSGFSAPNKTDKNKTDSNDTESSIPPPAPSRTSPSAGAHRQMRMDEMDGYRERIRENIGYDLLLLERPYDAEEIDGYVELMAETCASRREYIRVNGEDVPIELVRKRFLKLDGEHIRYVMDSLRQNTTQVVNIRAYTLAALYNAPVTISQYYTAQVSHDMAQGFGGA